MKPPLGQYREYFHPSAKYPCVSLKPKALPTLD